MILNEHQTKPVNININNGKSSYDCITGLALLSSISILNIIGAVWWSTEYNYFCPSKFSFNAPCVISGALKIEMCVLAFFITATLFTKTFACCFFRK